MKNQEIKEFYESVYQNYQESQQEGFECYERNQVLKKIYGNGQGKRLLDLGAGDGTISKFFLSQGYEVYALEWTAAGVEKLKRLGVKAQQADVENVPYSYEDNFFDEVFWGDNIEHLFFPEKVAREIYRILKRGGRLVLSTPNHGWIINRLYFLIRGVPRRTEGQKLPIWEWQHIRYFNKREIKRFLNYCDFIAGFKFHASERRQPFAFLSRYFPAIMGSTMIVEVKK